MKVCQRYDLYDGISMPNRGYDSVEAGSGGFFGSRFSVLDSLVCKRKVDHLRSVFTTQTGKTWFSDDTFLGLMRLRGVESRSPSGYAEAFYLRKLPLGVPCARHPPAKSPSA